MRIEAFLLELTCCTQDGTCLHGGNLGEGDTQATSTMTKHRIVLCQRMNALLYFFHAYSHLCCHCLLTGFIMGNKLMQRRIEQTYVYMQSVHSFQYSIEVSLLVGEQFGKSLLTSFYRIGENHLAHGNNLLSVKEHMLCTCQTDTLGSEVACYLSIMWRICIGANLHLGVFVAEVHQFLEVA